MAGQPWDLLLSLGAALSLLLSGALLSLPEAAELAASSCSWVIFSLAGV